LLVEPKPPKTYNEEMFNESIFKAYDIRGEYRKDFDDDFAKKLGAVVAKHLDAKKLVVARDMRPSSKNLRKQIVEGIISTGCDVIDIGEASTPLFYHGVISEEVDGGIMVTASHLGDEFGGFKVSKKGAITIGGDKLYKEAKSLFETDPKEAEVKGKVSEKDILEDYRDVVIKHSGVSSGDIDIPIKLTANKMVEREVFAVTGELGIPTVEERENIGFEFDADADRLIVKNSTGEKIRGDLIGGLLAGYYYPNQKIAYDLRYSRGVLEYMESKGIDPVPSRIGHTLIKAVMRENKIEFCGEQSGHIFFKEMGYVEVSILAMLKILNIMKETGKSIDELAEATSTWSTTEEINLHLDTRNKALAQIEKIKSKYNDGDLNDIDGIRVEYREWGFLLRVSNTEAKLRLIVDAKTKNLMEEKKSELLELLRECRVK